MEPSDPQQASRLQHPATRAHATTDLRAATAAEQYLAALGNLKRHAENAEAVTLSGNLPITQTGDLRPSRIAEIMRLEMENASLRAAYSDLEARYAALFSLHIKQPAIIPDAAPEFPARALTHQRQPIGLLTGRVE